MCFLGFFSVLCLSLHFAFFWLSFSLSLPFSSWPCLFSRFPFVYWAEILQQLGDAWPALVFTFMGLSPTQNLERLVKPNKKQLRFQPKFSLSNLHSVEPRNNTSPKSFKRLGNHIHWALEWIRGARNAEYLALFCFIIPLPRSTSLVHARA